MADQRQVLLASPIEMATTTTTTTTTIKQRHHRLQRRRRPLTTVLAGWTVPLPLISLLLLSCLLVATTTTTALHADEAGLNDFAIATAGHGRATYASYLPGTGDGDANDGAGVLVTSNSAQARDNDNIFGGKHVILKSCHVAARDASTGELLWRRDACSGPSPHRHRHSTSASVVVNSRGAPRRTAAYTLDDAGVLRGWHAGGGGDAGPRGPGEGGNDAAPPSDIVAGGAALFDVEVPGAASDSSEEESVAGYGPPRVRSFKGRPGKPPLVAALYPRSSVVIPTRLAGDDDEGGGDQASSRNVREIGASGGGGEEEEGGRALDGLSFHLGDTGNILPIIVDPDDNKKNTSDAVTAEQLLRISGAREPSGDGGGGGGGARIVAMEGQHGMGDRIAVVAAWPSSPDDATSCPCSSVAVFEFQRTYGGMGSIDPHAITMDHASVLECAGGGGKSQRIDLDSVRLVSTGGGGPMVVAALSASGDAALTAPVGRKGDAAGFGPTRVEASEIAGDGAVVLESLDVLTDGADGPTALPLLRMGSVGGGGGRPVVLAVGDDGTLGVAGGGVSSTPAIGGGGETEDPSARRSHLVAACRDPTDRNFVLLVRVDGVRPVGGGTCAGGGDADSDSDSDRYRLLLTRWEESTGDETVVARRTIRRPDSDGDSPPLRPSVHGDAVDLFVNCPGPHDRNKKIMAAQGAVPVAVSALLSTSGGSTVALSVHPANGTVDTSWIAEEGLADVRSVAFVDASHHHAAALAAAASAASSDQGEEDDDDDAPPTLGARLRMQLRSLGEASGYVRRVFAGPTDAERRDRDAGFGFAKVAVALADGGGGADVSENARVFGIDASLPGPAGGGGGDGRVRWSRLLPAGARRHVLVHGGGVGGVGHGGGGGGGGHGHHDHEVLVLSEMGGGRLEYECLDGVGGTVLDRGTSSLGGGGVVQVVPLRVGVHHHHHAAAADGGGHHHSPPPVRCRQHALVLAGDGRVSVVPDSPAARGAVLRSLLGGREDGGDDDGGDHYGGYYMHHVDVAGGTLRSLQVVPSSSSADGDEDDDAFATTVLVGEASFPLKNERIVSVGYPPADEVVQSPAAVLGDDSLLLKYLNPHLAAVVTRGTEDYVRRMEAEVARWGGADASSSSSSSSSPFASAFGGTGEAKVVGEGASAAGASSPGGGGPKRPLGATRPGEGEASASPAAAAAAAAGGSSAKSSAVPTLFVNLVDTVSGRVLYRVSHVGAEPYRDDLGGEEGSPSSDDVRRQQGVPVVVSENWVVYAFWNVKTKRTEVGVLTLHEGMIDRHGLTAFSGPHQEATFSGFEAPRPIVLHRTYGLAKTVTALGVTRTARGITPSQFVAALGSDQLLSIDRRLLDPRRPSGEVRDTEKAEGLLRYHPLVPLFPQRLVSYDVPVEGVRGVASAAASVESQSLVLAYGGPDVFFARVAPSKGFDLLPDSFNKGLLSVVVVALVCLVFVLQRMSGAKNLKVSWS